MAWRQKKWVRYGAIALAVLVIVAGAGTAVFWWKFLKTADQVFADDEARFKYGTLGGELLAGIPYPVFMVLPRVFPDLVEKYAKAGWGSDKQGHGGYGAFGFAWEEGQRLPAGFSIKRMGFERVSLNCALCHTTSYRLAPGDKPRFATGGPGHTVDMTGLVRFLFAAANDRRFTSARLMPEMALHFNLDPIDVALYSWVIIPKMRVALKLAEDQLRWIDDKPAWGPGRDDAFNLPKYVLTQSPWDDTTANTDFPALWRMGDRTGHLMHAAGEATSVYGVIATSALGTGVLPKGEFVERMQWIESFIKNLDPPKFPLPIDDALATRGRAVFAGQCASCHAKEGARTGTAIPLEEIGTDPEHVRTFTQANADRMNRVTGLLGLRDAKMQGTQGGYIAKPLVGVWLLAPYLHNGAVPTIADLLTPPAQRPARFHRGYDVLDTERVGFMASGAAAQAHGFSFDTGLRGNGNGGHLYGVDLSADDKRALIEFLKTL
jgi:mono/diheme cytochrome c family protein